MLEIVEKRCTHVGMIDKDRWIAAQTMECGAVLITFDQHFHDGPGLRVAP